MPVITWPKIIPIHTDNLTPMQIIFLVLFISIIVAIILICRLRCSRFRQQRRLNKNDEIINVPLLNDSEAEQSELRITFQESDDDYSEYIGKLNLLVSPKVHEELQQLIQMQNNKNNNNNNNIDNNLEEGSFYGTNGEDIIKLNLTILESLQTMAKEGKLFLNEMSLKISKRIVFSESYRPHIWQYLLENDPPSSSSSSSGNDNKNYRRSSSNSSNDSGRKRNSNHNGGSERKLSSRRRYSDPLKQPLSEEVIQLIELDVARSRFVNTPEEKEELVNLITLWLYMLPKGGEYRQGADTLAAICYMIFSKLNKPETGARMMLMICRKFIPSYFTDHNNNKYLEQRLCLFSSLLCFWDPKLASHLKMAGISPAMFSVPWFVTLFGDIWPIEKVLYLWDAMFVIGPDFMVFVAITILCHSTNRAKLLKSNFSQCMSFLSSLNRGEVSLNLRHCILKAISMYSQTPKSLLHYQNEERVDIAHKHLTQQFRIKPKFGRYVPGSKANEWSTGQFADIDDGKNLVLVIKCSDLDNLPEHSSVLFDLRNCTNLDHRWLVDRRARGAPTFHFPKLLELQEKVFETMEEEQYIKKQKRGIVAKLGRNLTSTSSSRKKRLINLRSSEEIILLLSKIKPYIGRYVILCVWENTDCSNVVEVLVRAGVPRVCTFLIDKEMQYDATMYMLNK